MSASAVKRDHCTPAARLAVLPQIICHEQPDWRLELVVVAATLLAVAWSVTAAHVDGQRKTVATVAAERDYWKGVVDNTERDAAVRIVANGSGFRCENFKVRREWERAVEAQCQALGGLLHMARAAQ